MGENDDCPFCEEKENITMNSYRSNGREWFFVQCGECLACGPVAANEKLAFDAWSRRPGNEQ